MLDRIGDEVARATSIVRYAPGSHFSPHVHDGGEEFLVPGSTMFVKLWQFDLADRRHVRLDTNKMALLDVKGRDGVRLLPLFKDAHEDVRLEQWAPGAAIEFDPNGGFEVLVLEGGFREGGETYGPQSWLRLPRGTHFSARAATDGCRVWIKEGHLRHVQAARPTGEGGE